MLNFVIAFIYLGNLQERSLEINISYFAILAFAAQKCLPHINGIYKASITLRSAAPIASDALNILDNAKFNLRSLDDTIKNKQPILHIRQILLKCLKV